MDRYIVNAHSSKYVLDLIRDSKIKIVDFNIIDNYSFSFKSSIVNRKKIRSVFPSARLVESKGILSLFMSLWCHKIVLFSLIISMCFYMYLSSFIWRVDIKGSNEYINDKLCDKMVVYGLVKGEKMIGNSKLDSIENKIYEEMKDSIEWLEIKKSGSTLDVSYLKRREEMDKSESRGKLYASRDCIIHSINMTSGNVLVSINQFVKKGELIVSDTIEVTSGGSKVVDTIGTIYGVTWYVIDVEVEKYSNDETEMFEYAMLKGKNELLKKVTNIINVRRENLLKYENESSRIRVRIHYEVLEDISMEE